MCNMKDKSNFILNPFIKPTSSSLLPLLIKINNRLINEFSAWSQNYCFELAP